jgi:hypothetical protein
MSPIYIQNLNVYFLDKGLQRPLHQRCTQPNITKRSWKKEIEPVLKKNRNTKANKQRASTPYLRSLKQ